MRHRHLLIIVFLAAVAPYAGADDLTVDSAIGGAVGGAIGGAVGAELGGREGAVIGAGVGAAAGTAINTRDHVEVERRDGRSHHYFQPAPGRFCPPGQAKKGRC